jgi:NADH-quinone oxidoreductase subunit N
MCSFLRKLFFNLSRFLFAILGILLMCSCNDLLTAYLAIELSSLAFYILASFRKVSAYSVESGIKYFIIGAISSAFFLLGSSFIYGAIGSINFFDFRYLFQESYFYIGPYSESLFYKGYPMYGILSILLQDPIDALLLLCWEFSDSFFFEFFGLRFIEFGLTFILFSLFIKLALAPFHLWALDVYEGSPTNSTFFFAVITKLSIFVLLARLCFHSFVYFKSCWQFYFLWVGILSIFVGSFGGLKQRKLKTLLAYSSSSHMGYILIALSTKTFLGLQFFLFYIFVYMLSSLAVWNIILLLRLKKKKSENKYNKELGDLALLSKSNPMLAAFLCVIMFSIAGIPPLVGFLAKMNVFLVIINISFYFVAFTSILCSIASTFYYIRIIKVLYFENLLVGKLYYPIYKSKIFLLSVLVFFLIYFFLNPTVLYLVSYVVIQNSFFKME